MSETPDERRRPDEDDDEYDDEDQAPSRRRILSRGRVAAAGFAVVVLLGGAAALILNGAGGDDNDAAASSSDDDPSSPEDAALEFAQCMRDNGIEEFPDPQISADGGISIGDSVADQRDTEEFQAAQEACRPVLDAALPTPEGQPLTPEERAELQDQWHAVAQCVRDQGYDFADPEIDEYGRFRMRAEGEGIEETIEGCANEIGLSEPSTAGGSSSGEAGGA